MSRAPKRDSELRNAAAATVNADRGSQSSEHPAGVATYTNKRPVRTATYGSAACLWNGFAPGALKKMDSFQEKPDCYRPPMRPSHTDAHLRRCYETISGGGWWRTHYLSPWKSICRCKHFYKGPS